MHCFLRIQELTFEGKSGIGGFRVWTHRCGLRRHWPRLLGDAIPLEMQNQQLQRNEIRLPTKKFVLNPKTSQINCNTGKLSIAHLFLHVILALGVSLLCLIVIIPHTDVCV